MWRFFRGNKSARVHAISLNRKAISAAITIIQKTITSIFNGFLGRLEHSAPLIIRIRGHREGAHIISDPRAGGRGERQKKRKN
jgi:hypothetical protein